MQSTVEERVLALLPNIVDGDRTASFLAAEGIACTPCRSMADLCQMARTAAGALLVAEESIVRDTLGLLRETLGEQPAWSSVPLIVLAREATDPRFEKLLSGMLANVTFVERPVRQRTLMSVIRSALRARRHQYEIRDALAERERQALALAEAKRQAETARGLAEAASRAKDEFLAMLGHELRNPLSPILTSLQLMRMRGTNTREQAVIERQVGHVVRLVDDLLDISRITRGKIEMRKARVELGAVVLSGLEMASPLLEQRRQRIDIDVPPEGLKIDADSDRLAQVISNLLTNAAKYSEPETTIHIRAERVESRARLEVRDEGIGIEPALLNNVFEVFFQQPQSLDRSKGGLGLGLAIVRSIVQLHGGTVIARSDGLGRGTAFIVELPLASGADDFAARPTMNVGHRAVPEHPSGPARTRILIVDDNVDATESMAEFLEELGYEAKTAHDGPEALRVAKSFKPSTCLIDIGLPVMDGYELARQLRGSGYLPDGARLIAVTGYGQDTDRRRSREAGFDAHLVKPVDVEVLTRAVVN
jgi:signal transduction histidine kinase/CheY-like chemotaxis protein